MKKLLLVLILAANIGLSQKLAEDKIDKFTGDKLKTTEWETIAIRVIVG